MSNVSQLKQRLSDFLKALERYDVGLEQDFIALEVAWQRLDHTWDGYAYQQFVGEWSRAQAMFRDYTASAKKYEMFLRDRIEALGVFDRAGGF